MADNITNQKIHLSTFTIIITVITAAAAVFASMIPFLTVYNDTVENDAEVGLTQSVRQTTLALENFLDDMESRLVNICGEIAGSDNLEEIGAKLDTAARIEQSIEVICVYDSEGELLVYGTNGRPLKSEFETNLSYDAELFADSDRYAVSLPHVQTMFLEYYPWVVTIVHHEYDALEGQDIYVAIDFSFSDIAEYVDNIGIGAHGYCYIIDRDGSIVYHPRQQMIFSGLIDESIDDIVGREDGTFRKGNIMRAISTLDEGGWRVVGVSYLDDLNRTRDSAVTGIISATFLCCAAVAVLVMIIYSQIITKPVASLLGAMKRFEDHADHYLYSPAKNHVYELQSLSDSFGHMTWMVQTLMQRIRSEEISLRKTELKALQAQINPHFLYNTLDSIQWMCERGNTDGAINMVSALGRLFRISISRGHELIPIRDELKHAESYLVIQKYRYSDRFNYRFDVDSGLTDYLCNKITLQPLIENAIYHGIEPLIDDGEIVISVKSDGDDILLSVADNGVGMTEEQCAGVLKKERSDSSGIGIKNVNDRVRIYFGEKYGLSIKSELDEGTTITVRIPRVVTEPDAEK